MKKRNKSLELKKANRSEKLVGTSALHKSGLASLNDLGTREWRDSISELEKIQSEFLSMEPLFRSHEYRKKWPSDSLHSWSRIWEYPYVYGNLAYLRHARALPQKAVVADVGSGVTFFPFALARNGHRVVCVDSDPICIEDLRKATKVVPFNPGGISVVLSRPNSIPLADKSVDVIVCISVLEHIHDPIPMVGEFTRLLRPGGICFLTIDLDLKGNAEMGPEEHLKLVETLSKDFDFLYPEKSVHPFSLVRTDNGSHPLQQPSRIELFRYLLQERVLKPLLGRESSRLPVRLNLVVQGFALVKK